ncbi:FG-GAP repeat domain-containing protein [Kitasatospora sp. HPMI-4]|uniref:FG-GAP repeat domain-containing protein n=1 Tax=Kitasatospora sp. HPMI-4 TaxID=3448443 RepID=UPI003F1D520F
MSKRVLSGLATAVLATTMAGAAGGTASAAAPSPFQSASQKLSQLHAKVHQKKAASGPAQLAAPRAATNPQNTPIFGLIGIDYQGSIYRYWPDGTGNFNDRRLEFDGSQDDVFKHLVTTADVDNNKDRLWDGTYYLWDDGSLYFTPQGATEATRVGPGWNIYDTVLSPGDLGGEKQADIIGRDRDGNLWEYFAYSDGTLTDRHKVGGGWNIYDQITGVGDLTGDGRPDIVARDKSGVLWLYKSNGNTTDPFDSRTRIGGGWDRYDKLVSTGDMDGDGLADLLARDRSGNLYFYKGNGNSDDPFNNPVRIGGGWNTYRLLAD